MVLKDHEPCLDLVAEDAIPHNSGASPRHHALEPNDLSGAQSRVFVDRTEAILAVVHQLGANLVVYWVVEGQQELAFEITTLFKPSIFKIRKHSLPPFPFRRFSVYG